jgi:hypothetical protein
MLPDPFFSIDTVRAGILSDSEIGEMLHAARLHSKDARLIGGEATSLESAGTEIHYRLLDGKKVLEHAPRLHELYEGEFLKIASRVFGVELITSPNLLNGVNINLLEGAGSRYEWHYDSNPFTALLVLSPSSEELGGRLLFGQESSTQVALSLSPGQLLFFDARKSAHAVEELRGSSARATVPMNFFLANEPIVRPEELDANLYGSNSLDIHDI